MVETNNRRLPVGIQSFEKTSNSQLIRLLEPIYLLRVREASD